VVVGIGILLTGYAPTFAALLVAWLWPGETGVRRLLKPVLRWQVSPAWYLVAFGGPILLFVVAVAIHVAAGGAAPASWLAVPSGPDLAFLVGALVAGSFGEEVGWRGFGQSRLQSRFTPLAASVIVGALWATWHLWPVITPGGGSTTWLIVVETYVRLIGMSVLYAWILNGSGSSVLLAMLAHAGHNVANRLVVTPPDGASDIPLLVAVLYAVFAALLVIFVRDLRASPHRAPPVAAVV
jgi:membrane protease YdiL (CAAX protease family)